MWGTDHEDQVGSEAFDERFVFEVIFSIFPPVKFILCLISRLWPAWGNTNFFDEIGLFLLK